MRLRIGTRGSALALAQAHWVVARLAERGVVGELCVIKTAGDRDTLSPFAAVGAPGIFVREIEQALLDERIDIAVHCYKDLPSLSPAELEIVAVPEREDPSDVLVALPGAVERGTALARAVPLAAGHVVGTSSARRKRILGELRPDLVTRELRGNVPTRIERLRRGDYAAIVLASAGLVRLARAAAAAGQDFELSDLVLLPLDTRTFVPAPAQGALALQARRGDARADAARALDLPDVHHGVRAERAFLRLADAGCDAVVGALAHRTADARLELVALIERDGAPVRATVVGADPEQVAREAWARLSGAAPPEARA
jgi:hydroxymethylbilane synthase